MTNKSIVRAWKDREYRASLSEHERNLLPENPAEELELTDHDLGKVFGGATAPPKPTMPSTTCQTKYHWCTLVASCDCGTAC